MTSQYGLSPLTRGNLKQYRRLPYGTGPIPAHAGEPLRITMKSNYKGAYPRSRGGTHPNIYCRILRAGLSPLTRGNHTCFVRVLLHPGPIPAHAGEPFSSPMFSPHQRAYPRSRGGTILLGQTTSTPQGLSPLTRGNQVTANTTTTQVGPIPAHAGEPQPVTIEDRRYRAYPRSRGGTAKRVDIA